MTSLINITLKNVYHFNHNEIDVFHNLNKYHTILGSPIPQRDFINLILNGFRANRNIILSKAQLFRNILSHIYQNLFSTLDFSTKPLQELDLYNKFLGTLTREICYLQDNPYDNDLNALLRRVNCFNFSVCYPFTSPAIPLPIYK